MSDEAGPSVQGQTEETLVECAQKFEDGIAAIKAGDYEKAVQYFSDVLQVRAKHYGQLAPEVASAYYRYGCALLYQAQESADVFGGPIRSTADGDKENDEEPKAAPPAAAPASADDKGKGPAEPEGEATAEGTEEEDGGAKAEADVEGDLQLAWENLEAARTIWAKDTDKNLAELAEVHSQLADVNMENEAFEEALTDLDSAMDYQKKSGVSDDDRKMADLQFRRCIVLQFLGRNKEALESVNASVAILQCCKDKAAAVAGDGNSDENTKAEAEKTVSDLTAMLDEIKDKVEELNEVLKEEEATRGMVRGMVAQFAAAQQQQQQGGSSSGALAAAGNDAQKPQGASPVKDLGIVGRGTKRINLAPTTTTTTEQGATAGPAPKKRALEDLMGAGPGGETTTGFGGSEKKEEAPAVPAFLQAFQKPAAEDKKE